MREDDELRGGRWAKRWTIAACAISRPIACSGQKPPAPPLARSTRGHATTGSPWRTAPPPTIQQVALLITTERGSEGIDEAGVRWWFPPPTRGGPAQTAAGVDTTVLSARYFDQEAGLVGITPGAVS